MNGLKGNKRTVRKNNKIISIDETAIYNVRK